MAVETMWRGHCLNWCQSSLGPVHKERVTNICVIFWAFLFLLWSSCLYFGGVFNKTIIPLALVGYEMIIANSALRASLAIYHLISNACSWSNC